MARFLLISVHYVTGPNKNEEISAKIGRAKDWAKFMPSTWLIWTDLDAAEWYERISSQIHENDTMFVSEIGMWKGRIPANVAAWVRRDRTADMDGE